MNFAFRMKIAMRFMAISCLSVNIYAQTESRFSGLEPIGHYADETLNKNDYQNALDQVFFKGHDFEYAFLVEPSFSEEYALLIGDGSLTALVADKQVWGFQQTTSESGRRTHICGAN